MGTWIEIGVMVGIVVDQPSFPSWERGLKFFYLLPPRFACKVVPFVGTWIEIISRNCIADSRKVVPFVGTWIEILVRSSLHLQQIVVPFVGTWIEITHVINVLKDLLSFPSWERGLK